MTIRLGERMHLIGGIRDLHISNGKGIVSENPAFDSRGGYVGWLLAL